jgi:hypothetical protein
MTIFDIIIVSDTIVRLDNLVKGQKQIFLALVPRKKARAE